MEEETLSKLKKQAGQVRYTDTDQSVTKVYKTFVLRDVPRVEYDWDFHKNKSIVKELEPAMTEGSFVFLETYFNRNTKTTTYTIVNADYSPYLSYGRDRNLLESTVYVDKKW